MNILILNWRDPKHPLAGGAEISLLHHAKYWQKKGAKITWFASSFKGAKEKEKFEDITILRRGSHYTVHIWVVWSVLTKKLHDFDLVIDSFHFLPFFTPLYMKKSKVIALINEVAGNVWFKNLLFPFAIIGYLAEPSFFIPYKHMLFITGSESAKKEVKKMGINKKNIIIIHHGVEIPKQMKKTKKTSSPTMLFLARISQDKGIQDVLQAYKILKEKYGRLQLYIAGKEESKGYLQKLLHENSLEKDKDIIVEGYISQERKFELLQKAWILVHASSKEGWGLTVIEANSVGTPVVGYNVAGLRDSIQNNRTGLLVTPTPEGLVHGIDEIFKNKKQYTNFSKNARQWAKNFSWEKSSKESWEVLNK